MKAADAKKKKDVHPDAFHYHPEGTCSTEMTFRIVKGKITGLLIRGGCAGNRRGMIQLVEGMEAADIIHRLKGIQCQNGTSCPDQLARAVEAYCAQHDGKKRKGSAHTGDHVVKG